MSSADLSDEDWEFDEPKQSHKKKRNPPAEPRKLMRWNPDTDQLALLCVDAVCARLNIAIPWDEVAKEVAPFLTGEGMKQHLGKLHLARESTGRKVPARPQKGMRRKAQTKVKEEEDDEAAHVEQRKVTNKLAGLLYHGPETQPKKMRTPKQSKAGAAATTPGGSTTSTGAGRKRAKTTLDREKLLGTPTKSTTGKRGRKSRVETVKEDEDDDYAQGTPSKRQKQYSLRAISKEPVYNQDNEIGDDENEEEAMLAFQDDGEIGDDDYQEDEAGEDDKMEDAEEPKVVVKKNNATSKMLPPPGFNLTQELMNAEPELYGVSKSQPQPQHATNQLPGIQTNPLQAPHGYDFGGYGTPGNISQDQDPLINATPRTVPKMDHIQELFPQQEVSALRSTLNKTPITANDEGSGNSSNSGSEKHQSKTRKKPQQQVLETPARMNRASAATQFTTPARQMSTPGVTSTPSRRLFSSVTNSPFNTPQQNQAEIDANIDLFSELGQVNYTSSMPIQSPSFHYPDAYSQSAHRQNAYGAGMVGINYMPQYRYAPGMGHPSLHISTDDSAALFAADVMPSPDDDIHMSAHSGASFPVQGAFCNDDSFKNFNNINGMSGGDNSSTFNFANSASMPQHSQISGARPTASHDSSFDSMATSNSVKASQTDEANDNMYFDGVNESQHFDDAMGVIDYNASDMFDEEPFGST